VHAVQIQPKVGLGLLEWRRTEANIPAVFVAAGSFDPEREPVLRCQVGERDGIDAEVAWPA
jgi:hypothetical protein